MKNQATISPRLLQKDLASVKNAIDNGEAIEGRDKEGRTALMHAVLDGRSDLVALLLDCGANPNLQESRGFTALHFAAQDYQLQIAADLIKHGALLDVSDRDGNSPLWRAVFASSGRGEMIKILLAAGALPNKTNNHGVSPSSLAKSIANYNVSKYFD